MISGEPCTVAHIEHVSFFDIGQSVDGGHHAAAGQISNRAS